VGELIEQLIVTGTAQGSSQTSAQQAVSGVTNVCSHEHTVVNPATNIRTCRDCGAHRGAGGWVQ